MVLIALAGLCVLSVPLRGGNLARLAEIRLRGLWIPVVALALQVVITVVAPGGNAAVHRALHILTYAMIGLFLWVNRRLAGLGDRRTAVGPQCTRRL
jgi:purine-cytosine permease-like protein